MSLLLGPTSSSQSAMTTSSEKSPLHKHFLFPDHFGEVSEMLVESQTLIKVAHTKPILAIKQGMSCEGAIPLLHTFSNKIARNCYFLF